MSEVILNSYYLRESWEKTQYGKHVLVKPDCLILVIKNVVTGKTRLEIVEKPDIDYYIVKEEFRHKYTYHRLSAPLDELEKITVKYARRDISIARNLGIENEFLLAKRNGDSYNFKATYMLSSPYLYYADTDIESYYKMEYQKKYGDVRIDNLNKSCFDIEVDIYGVKEKCDQHNPIGKINLITFFNEQTNELYAFVLNEKNAGNHNQIEDIKNDLDNFIKEDLYNDYKDNENIKIIINFYDTEEDVIIAFFGVIHVLKPDFCTAWNSNYDILYIINRCKNFLNINPVMLFTHPDVPPKYRVLTYIEDKERKNGSFAATGKSTGGSHPSRYWDWLIAPGYTTWMDAMSCYSNLRKRRMEKSYKLDNVAQLVLQDNYKKIYNKEKEMGITGAALDKFDIDVRKVNLSDYGTNIRNVPYRNFRLFLKYGLRDTYLLKRMETVEGDIDRMLISAPITPLKQVFKISYIIKDIISNYLFKKNFVIGNNINYNIKEKTPGAIVADPKHIDIEPEYIDGVPSSIYKFIVDFDASSMYPSIMRAYNICKDTVYGKIILVEDKYTREPIIQGDDFTSLVLTLDTSILDLSTSVFGMNTSTQYIKEFEDYLRVKNNENKT